MIDKATITVGPWPKGVDTRSPDYAVPEGTLRDAVNVDLLRDGHVRRRKGYAKLLDIVDPHSLYSCPAGVFFVAQNILYRLNDDDSTTALYTGLIGRPVTYEYFNGDIFFSDGYITKKLVAGTTIADWGIAAPSIAPFLLSTTGNLDVGTYIGAVSFISASGEESSLSPIATIQLYATGGIIFAALPPPTSADVTHLRIYLSTANGSVLYHATDITVGTASYTVNLLSDTGKEADITTYSTPPPCNIVRQHYGRMYCAVDNTVWFTEPFALGRVNTAKNFWQFSSPITVLEPVEAGIYIVADNTYFYRCTDPDTAKVELLLSYGAVPYTAVKLPHGDGVIWQSIRGAVMGDVTGKVKNIQEEYVTPPPAETGAAVLRESNGVRQYIATLSTQSENALTASSFFEAEIIRKGY